MKEIRTIKGKPLPYYTCDSDRDERIVAAALRREFIPKMQRRLPGHHLLGHRHDYIVRFIERNKKKYPYYLKTDIKKFYPSVRHLDIVTGFQIAYRDLINLEYVPRAFQKRYVRPVNEWCKGLPLHQGIPLGSSLSAILAPLMLVPMWLHIKRKWNVPFIVYMDDVLVCAPTEMIRNQIYAYIENYLTHEFELNLNVDKTRTGRIGRDPFDFCGWHFAGGYAGIATDKVNAFKERIRNELKRSKQVPLTALIKRLNYKINGFGHYYKYGHVKRTYEQLDAFIRSAFREACRKRGYTKLSVTNGGLTQCGLHNLEQIYHRCHLTVPVGERFKVPVPPVKDRPYATPLMIEQMLTRLIEVGEKIVAQNRDLLQLQRKQLRVISALNEFNW